MKYFLNISIRYIVVPVVIFYVTAYNYYIITLIALLGLIVDIEWTLFLAENILTFLENKLTIFYNNKANCSSHNKASDRFPAHMAMEEKGQNSPSKPTRSRSPILDRNRSIVRDRSRSPIYRSRRFDATEIIGQRATSPVMARRISPINTSNAI